MPEPKKSEELCECGHTKGLHKTGYGVGGCYAYKCHCLNFTPKKFKLMTANNEEVKLTQTGDSLTLTKESKKEFTDLEPLEKKIKTIYTTKGRWDAEEIDYIRVSDLKEVLKRILSDMEDENEYPDYARVAMKEYFTRIFGKELIE